MKYNDLYIPGLIAEFRQNLLVYLQAYKTLFGEKKSFYEKQQFENELQGRINVFCIAIDSIKDLVKNYGIELTDEVKDILKNDPYETLKIEHVPEENVETYITRLESIIHDNYGSMNPYKIYNESEGYNSDRNYNALKRELFKIINQKFNDKYFDEDGLLKEGFLDNISAGYQYFSEYRELMDVFKEYANNKIKPRPWVHWLSADRRNYGDIIYEWNNAEANLNTLFENGEITEIEYLEKYNQLEKEKEKILDMTPQILDQMIDEEQFLSVVGDKSVLGKYQDLINKYNDNALKTQSLNKELTQIYKAFEQGVVTDEQLKDWEEKSNEGEIIFKENTKLKDQINEVEDILFNKNTENLIQGEVDLIKEMIYLFRKEFEKDEIEEIFSNEEKLDKKIENTKEPRLKKLLELFKSLNNSKKKIEEFREANKQKLKTTYKTIFTYKTVEEYAAYKDEKQHKKEEREKRPSSKTTIANTDSSKSDNDKKDSDDLRGDVGRLPSLDNTTMHSIGGKGKTEVDPKTDSKIDPPKTNPPKTDPKIEHQNEELPKGEVLTLEAIYYKVMGTKSFTHQQERRYHASQIKIFQNPFAKNPKNAKRGNAYRVGSFLEGLTKIVFGVIAVPIRLIRKGLASLFQSHESKQIFEDIKARAMNLTDKEVEVILNEYYNTTALEFRATPIFGEAIMPRVNKYISERVTKINQRITELTMNIMLYTNAGERFRQLAADPKIDDTHRAMYNGLANLAFKKAGNCIDELLIKKNEGDILCDGKGYHALQEDIRAQQTGLNYYGGRFANNHGYEGKVFDEVSTLANIYKDKSIDPEKRAKAFLKNREYHIAHDKKKRMARNLWSKVDVGELSYRPYVEMIDYDRDPLIQQYLTAAMLAVGIASMIRNITNVIRSNRTDARNLAIDKQNQQAANNVTSQNQAASGKINGYVDEVEKARNVGVDGTQRSVDAIEQAGYQDIATGHQAREWANTVDNGFHTERASYISADDLVHGSSADATESFRAGIADINQDYAQGLANGNLDHASMVQRASEQYLGSSTVTGARQYLTDSIGQLNSVIQKQGHTGGKGYDYTALETMTRGLEQSLSVGGIDTAVSTLTEFHTTLCTLPVLSNLNLCTSLVLTPSAAAGLDLLSTAALNAGALGSAAALAGTRENTSGMSIDQGDMESLIEDMRSAGVSEDEISKAMSEISNEYTPEPSKGPSR